MSEDVLDNNLALDSIKQFEDILCKEIIDANNIFICGHVNSDYDALASSFAAARICKYLNKYAYIVIPNNDIKSSAKDDRYGILNMIKEKQYILLDSIDKRIMTDNDLLIVVDTSVDERIPINIDYDEFCDVVIIDHHAKAENIKLPITCNGKKPTELIIPKAISSASEILYYLIDGIILKDKMNYYRTDVDPNYFTALLAGINLDTDRYHKDMFSSTHDCVSSLIKHGASQEFVDSLFKRNLKLDQKIYDLVFKAESFTNRVMIAVDESGKYTHEEISMVANRLSSDYKNDVVFVFTKQEDGKYDYCIRTSNGTFGVAEIARIISDGAGGGRENAASGNPIYIDKDNIKEQSITNHIQNKVMSILRFKNKRKETND